MAGDPDLDKLLQGDKRAWDRFVVETAPVIYAAARRRLAQAGRADDADDVVQDVYVKLCRSGFKVLRGFDPQRAKLTTFLTVVATTTAIDHLRKIRPGQTPIEQLPEGLLAVDAVEPARVAIPDGLLPERQALIIKLLYQREMEVAEVARLLGIEAQTVRSLHHKALTRLRAHFGKELEWERQG